MELIAEEPLQSCTGGWYNTRCQYRSVAFGTWKVGGARQITERVPPIGKQLIQTRSLDANRNYLMQEAFETYRSENSSQIRDELDSMNTLINETYSVRDSTNLSDLDTLNGNSIFDEPTSLVVLQRYSCPPQRAISFADANRHFASLSRRKRERLESSMQRVHQRSRSAGNDALFTVLPAPSTSALTGPAPGSATTNTRLNHHKSSTTSIGSISALKATKKFFKKIYASATLPGRSHSKTASSDVQIEHEPVTPPGPFFEIRYSSDCEDEDRCSSELGFGQFPSLMQCADQDSTPSTLKSTTDDPMNDSLLTKSISSNDSQKTSSTDFHSWNEVFDHLKREMKYIRDKDAQILSDLQQVETQLRNVKNCPIAVSQSDYSMRSERNTPQLGSLVDSMPL